MTNVEAVFKFAKTIANLLETTGTSKSRQLGLDTARALVADVGHDKLVEEAMALALRHVMASMKIPNTDSLQDKERIAMVLQDKQLLTLLTAVVFLNAVHDIISERQ